MSDVIHGSFVLGRRLAAPPGRVFAAYAKQAERGRWFRMPGDPGAGQHELDFRIGGHEILRGSFAPSGVPEVIEYRSCFFDIVPDARLVFTYELALNGLRRLVSLVTIALAADGAGTQLEHTEQYSFLEFAGDGHDDVAHLEGGTRLQLNGLAAVVEVVATAR